MVSSEDWNTIKRLFFEVRDLPPVERADFLARSCVGREDLRAEVESLLAHHDEPDSFLAEPVRPRKSAGPRPASGERIAGETEAEAHGSAAGPDPLLESGTILGPYEILAPLGAGGMGEIYRALDRRLDREVALKVLPRQLASDATALARFHREARLLASVSHPNLVTIHDVGRERGIDFLVMELVAGETLRARLLRGPLSSDRALGIALEIARALDAAHRRGIVHRDLKPENVLVDSNGRVRVLDFGLAREMSRGLTDPSPAVEQHITRGAVVLGTPGYMAPEQVRGEAADARTDLFAFGCVLYEMLAGVRPFRAPTPAAAFGAVLRDDPPPLPKDRVDPAMAALVARCLEKDRGRRPPDAATVVRELQDPSAEPPVLDAPAREPGSTGPATAAPAAWRRLAAGIGSLLAVLALVWLLTGAESGEPDLSIGSVQRVAVLPVEDRTGESGSSVPYLADGVTEAWIQDLSRLEGLRVISRASVFQYRDRDADPLAIAAELDVDALLLGEIRPAASGLTLSAELVDGKTGHLLWGSARTGAARELDEMNRGLVTELASRLGRERGAGRAAPERARVDPEAYRLYLQGRYQWNRRDPEGLRNAIDSFQRALAIDPTFARAHAGLADVYSVLHTFVNLPTSETFPRARAAAERALERAPDLAEARVSLAYVEHYWEWNWSGAEADYRAALAQNPSYAPGWQFYGELLTTLGRFDEAYAASLRAQELDPLSPMIHAVTGWNLEMAGRFEQAIATQRRNLKIFPGFNPAEVYLARSLVQIGRADEGIEIFEKDVEALRDRPIHRSWLAWAYASGGRIREAREQLDELYRIRARGDFVLPYYLAYPHIALGELDQALELLAESVDQKDEQVVWLGVDPTLDPLRDRPEFLALLERAGLSSVR